MKAKKYSGEYYCLVNGNPYGIGSEPMSLISTDTVYNRTITVEKDKRKLSVLGSDYFDVTDIVEGKKIEFIGGCTKCSLSIVFNNDSLHLRVSSGGLGGGSTSIFDCVKQ